MSETRAASPRLLHSIQPKNFLSFGPESTALELGALNILIGPNGSGKSNLIEAIALLRATAISSTSLGDTVRRGGGIREWIWKGSPKRSSSLKLNAIVDNTLDDGDYYPPLRHNMRFEQVRAGVGIADETIEYSEVFTNETEPYFFYDYQNGAPIIHDINRDIRKLRPDSVVSNQSILSQRNDPEQYPAITRLASQYVKIALYREWIFGRNTLFRQPQQADMRTDRLEEDFSNMGLFLNKLRRSPQAKTKILDHLRDIYEGVDDFDVSVEGGTVQVFFTEGDFTIPALRLSDGTLRYLCLLAILCDPTPPPLICIEEPELGLHPDIIPKIADLLLEASTRTQLIVTTHSDILIDAMTERPETVIVCEKREGQTQMKRLSSSDLAVWLEKYRLGELWTRGELGGTRW